MCTTPAFLQGVLFIVEWNARVRLLLAVFFCFDFLVQFFVDVLVQNRFLFGKFFIGYIFVSGFFQQLVILFGFLFVSFTTVAIAGLNCKP